ncbi:transcriptional regulator, TetR family [Nannocystis exedens]|uniref:Transcriptional regulator, TetR family n=1 Tax=Nannocystis exedens TaxID=54 RepID=A0A1I2BVV7_9BACT|nr:TetR/AcrR family transcriptional regulator C-terminal ligand-binding domain-containing protein [Nannocystis exedens]PCC71220.1 Bacterial regulatory protein, tetR family [Nannocystis exedens]SFE60296.1 transcriptional regulator, TetR family [Nannocystis exedens]
MRTQGQARRSSETRGEAVVRKVLAAALREVGRAGYHGLRIEEVAARAGVNKTTVYRRWPTKQALLRDALLSITSEVFTTPRTGSLRGDVLAYARRNAALAARPEYRGLFRIFVAEGEDAELLAIVRSLREAFEPVPREVLTAARARGEIGAGADPALLFEVLGAALNWWLFFEHTPTDEAFLHRLVDLMVSQMSQRATEPADITVEKLLAALDCGRATLYRYIDRGLLPPPIEGRRGRPARWSPEALARAKKIRTLLAQGFTLATIEQRLAGGSRGPAARPGRTRPRLQAAAMSGAQGARAACAGETTET